MLLNCGTCFRVVHNLRDGQRYTDDGTRRETPKCLRARSAGDIRSELAGAWALGRNYSGQIYYITIIHYRGCKRRCGVRLGVNSRDERKSLPEKRVPLGQQIAGRFRPSSVYNYYYYSITFIATADARPRNHRRIALAEEYFIQTVVFTVQKNILRALETRSALPVGRFVFYFSPL